VIELLLLPVRATAPLLEELFAPAALDDVDVLLDVGDRTCAWAPCASTIAISGILAKLKSTFLKLIFRLRDLARR
jgi:hypothetical protein